MRRDWAVPQGMRVTSSARPNSGAGPPSRGVQHAGSGSGRRQRVAALSFVCVVRPLSEKGARPSYSCLFRETLACLVCDTRTEPHACH
ncbi:uncharacterized protein P884DRAFT_259273 [Thermothelomyces heterothallicus CBS 202.75]|uniref:uncharacterized protein n=1 Tax=Thermothelomyces heterothallicus CBS 202.75 TaxID=1149848 RepID=UPI00374403C8